MGGALHKVPPAGGEEASRVQRARGHMRRRVAPAGRTAPRITTDAGRRNGEERRLHSVDDRAGTAVAAAARCRRHSHCAGPQTTGGRGDATPLRHKTARPPRDEVPVPAGARVGHRREARYETAAGALGRGRRVAAAAAAAAAAAGAAAAAALAQERRAERPRRAMAAAAAAGRRRRRRWCPPALPLRGRGACWWQRRHDRRRSRCAGPQETGGSR
jgi:hypothetical protein